MKRKPKSAAEAITRAVDEWMADHPEQQASEVLKALAAVFKLLWNILPRKLPKKGDGIGGYEITARLPHVKVKRIAA